MSFMVAVAAAFEDAKLNLEGTALVEGEKLEVTIEQLAALSVKVRNLLLP